MSDTTSFDGSTGLSALTNADDVEPLLSVGLGGFADAFVIDDDDPLWEIMEEEALEEEDLMQIGGQDFIDIVGAFLLDEPQRDDNIKEKLEFKKFNYKKVPKGRKIIKKIPPVVQLKGKLTIKGMSGSTSLLLTNGKEDSCIGWKKENVDICINVEAMDYFKIANMYSEEVGGKGVSLGFSSFYHSVAIMILAKNSVGVIEPHEGYDYATQGYTIEVTGVNFMKRSSEADIVLSKYELVGTICHTLPNASTYRNWSYNEDCGMLNSFAGTAFDYEMTTRSEIVSKIAALMPYITSPQRSALGSNYLAYRSEQPVIDRGYTTRNRDFTKTLYLLDDAMQRGAKERNGVYYVPSPFRVLYPKGEPDDLPFEEIVRRQSVQVRTTQWGKSTYHTWDIREDPRPVLMATSDIFPEKENYTRMSVHDLLHQSYKKYDVFTAATIQSALLPKINGKGGCFYDVYNRIGISWFRQSSSSLCWYALYYSFSPVGPINLVGQWHHDKKRELYLSPTFKVSRQDIHYAQVLPSKVVSCLASCRPLVSPQEYRDVEPKIMMTIGIQSNSTWSTSFRTGANRFLTCCHISDSGDLPSLIEGQLNYMNYHRFCDHFVLYLMKQYILESPDVKQTPLFRLPIPIMSYEKDFSQTLQWHMRDTDHSTNCMRKVTDAAKRHHGEEDATNLWLELQYDFLVKMMQKGCDIEDYKKLMKSAPSFPTLNLVMFIGMCSIVKDDIKDIGSVQHSMGFTVWKMMTDRHCTEYLGTTRSGLPQLQTSKVVEAMSTYIRSLGGVSGAYELIAKMASSTPLPPNYLLNHYKDAKEAEREISQMFPQHRIKQCLPEVLIETFTGNNDADQMSDTLKYNKHVMDTMDVELRGKAMHSSEDRSKFCQEQEPQLQGLAIAAIAAEAGSTALRSAAAMTFMNKTRVVVYPHDANHEELIGEHPSGDAVIVSQKKKHFTKTVRIEKNMTQGLGAVTAGAVNTIYVTAQDKIITKLIDGLESKSARTTSDDVKRTACYKGECDFDHVATNYFTAPNQDLTQCMMVENKKKPIVSYVFSEFNNVVASITGMIPQSPIFSTLCIQPLLSKSLFGDIVSVVNISRSTMSWGCPPDTMQASMNSMIRVLRQKWLLSDLEMDTLWLSGFFPRSIPEHISGFWIRNEEMLKRIFSALDDEQRKDILSGDVPLYDMLKRAELDLGRQKKKKRQKHEHINGLHRANRVAESIYRQRYTSERLMTRHIQPIAPHKRQAAKNRFFELISGEVPDIDITMLQTLAPPKVTVSTRAARRKDRLPTSIGTSAELSTLSLQRIRARRHLGVHYRDFPTEEESRIADLAEDEYNHEVAKMEKIKHYEGLSYKSPVGLPLTRIFDNTIFTRPASFNFSVDLGVRERVQQPFTYRGIMVSNFKPVILGSDSLNRIPKIKRNILAFGTGLLHGKRCVFYKKNKLGEDMQAVRISDEGKYLTSVSHLGNDIFYRLSMDASPLLSAHHGDETKPHLPGLLGDNEAIMNYGFFCRSNQPNGFAVYRSLFSKYNSVMPYFVMQHMPQYPFFPYRSKTTEIPRAKLTALVNYRCISKLKLIMIDEPKELITISLDGNVPTIADVEMEEEIIEEW